jgi:hypothetical protein
MSESDVKPSSQEESTNSPSRDFAAYCESEFERRINSGIGFDEAQYRKAMTLVLDKLARLEGEGRS